VYKIVFCLRRLPELSLAQFSEYWQTEHAALFQQYAAALGVARYRQTHRRELPLNAALRATRDAPEAFDGVAEVWFASLDDLYGGVSSPAGRAAGAALISDEKRFIDHANSPIWIAEEIEVALPDGPPGRPG
jgi:uncharacterized protein (TIGR02118 family)